MTRPFLVLQLLAILSCALRAQESAGTPTADTPSALLLDFVAAMQEMVKEKEQIAGVRRLAGLASESLTGVAADQATLGDHGFTTARSPAGAATMPAYGAAIPGVVYTAPAGWSREQARRGLTIRGVRRNSFSLPWQFPSADPCIHPPGL